MDKTMKEALEADGKKLRQMTGEFHGPIFMCDCGLALVLEEEKAADQCVYCTIYGRS